MTKTHHLLHALAAAVLSVTPLVSAHAQEPSSSVTLTALRTEYKINPLGIDVRSPRLSWQLRGSGRGVAQSAYQIKVAAGEAALKGNGVLVWDSGRIESGQSIHRPYGGPAPASGKRYYWQARVWDSQGKASGWSKPAYWEMGLLSPSDWTASWIEPDLPDDPKVPGPVPILRRSFQLKSGIVSARAYATSYGLYELRINGKRVGDELFTPGWTSYKTRLQYQTYDVTKLLKSGSNAVGAMLGNGWYRGEIGFSGQRNHYGSRLALLCQIRVTYKDGSEETIGTDDRWKASTGATLLSEIYHGDTADARLEKDGWSTAAYNDKGWTPAKTAERPKDNLIAPAGPPVRKIEELKTVRIFKTPAGETVADLGQNMVGWVKLTAQGPAGTTITLRHSEVLDGKGNFYTENLRAARQTAKYTLRGGGMETFEPHFSFQGFRYVAVDGYPGELTPAAITGVVIHSDMLRTSEFATSNALINQLQHNIIWGQKGNFLDVPTDCPQRDERLGWTGDAQAFSSTAMFNMDTAGFFTKWMKDVEADQYANGSVPHVIPNVLGSNSAGATGWADAATIIPWNVYLAYGDERILAEQYSSMSRWVAFMRARAGDDLIWTGDFHFGDWLDFGSSARGNFGATPTDLLATAFFAHSTEILAKSARILGKRQDSETYEKLAAEIKAAFCAKYVKDDGSVGTNTQTGYVLALELNLLPTSQRERVARRLVEDVRQKGHLTTGFLGTPHLMHALSRYGYLDDAYKLLNRDEFPSWLYPVKKGATTIWERWDGIKPDGSFQDKGMNSFNHYAYGAVGDWMYRVMAGIEIDPAAPGYRHITIAPRPGGGFTQVRASHMSLYGRVTSSWRLRTGELELTVEVPANSRATVRLADVQVDGVKESGKALANGNGIMRTKQDGSNVEILLGSGIYRFTYPTSVAAASPGRTALR